MHKVIINYRFLVFTMVILFTWLGLVRNIISFRLGGVVFELISIVLMIITFFLRDKSERSFAKEKNVLILVLVFSILYFSFSFIYKAGHFTEVVGITIPVYAYNTLLNVPLWVADFVCFFKTSNKEKRIIFKLFNLIIVYDIIITLIALTFDVGFVKARSAGMIIDGSYQYAYLGAMGYELTYSVLLLVPIYFYLGIKKKQWLCLSISLLSLIFVVMSSFFIAIVALMLLCIISCFFIAKSNFVKISLIVGLVTFLIIAINTGLLGHFFIWLTSITDNYELGQRFLQVGNLLLFGDSSGRALLRLDLYNNSLIAILSHPLFGVLLFNPLYPISDHSTLLDVWAGFGIITFVFFILIPIELFILFYKTQKSTISNLMIASLLIFVFVATFNQILISPHILLIVTFIFPIINTIFNEDNCTSIQYENYCY